MGCLLLAMLALFPLAYILRELSFEVAYLNPEVENLRVPILSLGLFAIGVLFINLLLSEVLLGKVLLASIISESSVRILKLMSWLYFIGLLPITAVFALIQIYVGSSMPQLYVVLAALAYLAAALVFRLWSNLMAEVLDPASGKLTAS